MSMCTDGFIFTSRLEKQSTSMVHDKSCWEIKVSGLSNKSEIMPKMKSLNIKEIAGGTGYFWAKVTVNFQAIS